VVVVCGPSGSGKSTLIKTINALEPFQKGEITVDGVPVHDPKTDLPKLRSRVGMVFQHFELFPHLSVTDNLTILGQPVRWKTMDGSFANVTAQSAFDIVAAAGDLDARLFAVAETHRAAMEAAPDPAAYDFSAGWPETFGG